MEKEELLHGKTKMRGLHTEDSESEEEIEIFNRRRPGNQGKSCEVCGVLLVVLCLTFFASTVIFGVRYMSALRQLEVLRVENERLTFVITDPELSEDVDTSNQILDLRQKVSKLQEQLQNCQRENTPEEPTVSTLPSRKSESGEESNSPRSPVSARNSMNNPSDGHDLTETPKNIGSRSYWQRFEGILLAFLILGIHRLLVG